MEKTRKNEINKTFTVPLASVETKDNVNSPNIKSSKSSKKEIINLAIKLHLQGNISEAQKYYTYCINQGFDDPRVFSNYGIILQDLGKLKTAEIVTRKAIELNPNFAEAHSNLGIILKDFGKLEEAKSSLSKAIKLKPNYINAHYNLGIILSDLGKLKEAEISTKKAIDLNPTLANAHSNLAIILKDQGQLKEAEISARKAIKLNPNFAEAHSNLGSILKEYGQLAEALASAQKAVELKPKNQSIKINLINMLTIYTPKHLNSNPLYLINEEFKCIDLYRKENDLITDIEAVKIYQDGLEIYKKYNLDLETSLSQIYKRSEINLNCKRHMNIFDTKKIIPEYCFGCYKVQVEADSIIELIKLFIVFNSLKLKNANTRKCMVELRAKIPGFYKGLIYCFDLNEALEVSKQVNHQIQKNIKIGSISKVKRGCSEYPLEFPKYKEINTSGEQPMNYEKKWKSIEETFDKEHPDWGTSNKSIEGFSLNHFLIMRNWIAYAQKIEDESVNKVTRERIKGPQKLNYLNRKLNP